MYKVLLVDDEYMITEGLKRLIPFDKWDMEVRLMNTRTQSLTVSTLLEM